MVENSMILKSCIFVCTIVWIWSCGARCETDASPGPGKTNPLGLSKAKLHQPVNGSKVDINQVKPTVKKASLSGKDHQKNNTKPSLLKSSLNVNVNHGGSLDRRPYNRRRNRYGSLQGSRRRKKHRLRQLIDTLPIANIDYNEMHPDGNVRIHRRKPQTRRSGNNLERLRSDDFALIEGGGTKCYPVVMDALEYLRLMEINLRNVDRKLKLLLRRLPNENSYENFVRRQSKYIQT